MLYMLYNNSDFLNSLIFDAPNHFQEDKLAITYGEKDYKKRRRVEKTLCVCVCVNMYLCVCV